MIKILNKKDEGPIYNSIFVKHQKSNLYLFFIKISVLKFAPKLLNKLTPKLF